MLRLPRAESSWYFHPAMEPTDPHPALLDTALGPVAITREGTTGPALLCTHGIPGSRRDFRYLAPHLSDQFQVVRVETPGFGESPAGRVVTIGDWAQTINAVADALALPRYCLLGHSFGGGPALHAAAAWPDRVTGLALLASIGGRRHRAIGPFPPWAYRGMARLARWPGTRSPVGGLARWSYRRRGLEPPAVGDWQTLYQQLRLVGSVDFAELGRLAARITAPTVVAHCLDDRLVQASIAESLARTLPNGRWLSFPSGGHYLQKTRAAEIAAALRETLLVGGRA